MDFVFFLNSILFGIGLAMDAFSVSMANGLNEPKMKKNKTGLIAGTFAFFQSAMSMIGWICIHTVTHYSSTFEKAVPWIARYFNAFEKAVPWIALVLLLYIGGKMLIEGIKNEGDDKKPGVGFKALMVQGVATSIDALSVGFTISDFNLSKALVESLIIAVVTFFICVGGLLIGRKVGTKLSGKASILGGVILIGIGIEIFVKGVFFS